MIKKLVMLTFAEEIIKEPVIYNLGQHFKITTNIQLAELSENKGWVVLELEGEEEEINDGIAWVNSKGVRVDPL